MRRLSGSVALFLDYADFQSCRSFRSLVAFKLDALALVKGLEAINLDRAKMNEKISTLITFYKAESLLLIEPLDNTFRHSPLFSFLRAAFSPSDPCQLRHGASVTIWQLDPGYF